MLLHTGTTSACQPWRCRRNCRVRNNDDDDSNNSTPTSTTIAQQYVQLQHPQEQRQQQVRHLLCPMGQQSTEPAVRTIGTILRIVAHNVLRTEHGLFELHHSVSLWIQFINSFRASKKNLPIRTSSKFSPQTRGSSCKGVSMTQFYVHISTPMVPLLPPRVVYSLPWRSGTAGTRTKTLVRPECFRSARRSPPRCGSAAAEPARRPCIRRPPRWPPAPDCCCPSLQLPWKAWTLLDADSSWWLLTIADSF